MGAGRTRLLRQLLTESLLLAILGTVAGLLLNLLLTRLISQVTPDNLPVPVAFHISPDWRLLAYASALATASAVLVGLLPACRASRAKAKARRAPSGRQAQPTPRPGRRSSGHLHHRPHHR